MGQNLMTLTYKDTLLDPEFKPDNDPAHEEDDFDTPLTTAMKVSSLSPILKPEMLECMIIQLRKHCAEAAKLAITSYTHDPSFNPHKNDEPNVATGDMEEEEDFPRLVKFAPQVVQPLVNEPKVDIDQEKAAADGNDRAVETKEPFEMGKNACEDMCLNGMIRRKFG